ncbi:MAG: NAD(P) transhydrogenase subunit alpha [Candidatus Nanopelagicales bacterium]|nr:NAD(P) transhydrogenase subunit alpha [Candidatus Nanopelagicales bacterium]
MTTATTVLASSGGDVSEYSQIALLTIFILSIFVGFEVISKVSSILHTPLMSGANAIHGIVLLGAILVTAPAEDPLTLTLGTVAVVLGSMNLVGGFVVTDRMLEMFKSRGKEQAEGGDR